MFSLKNKLTYPGVSIVEKVRIIKKNGESKY